MSRDKQLIGAVLALAVVGGVAIMQFKKDQKVGSTQVRNVELPEIKGSDDIDKIQVTNADKTEVIVQKNGDKWALVKPVNAPANQQSVKSLLDNLKELKVKDSIAEKASDEELKDYALDNAHAVRVTTFKGADKKLSLTFGKSGARGQLVTVEGKPGVFTASGYSGYLYTREVKGWRDTEVTKFDDSNVNQVTLVNKDGTLSFTKADDKWAGTLKGAPIARFDVEKVKEMIRNFKNLNADDFGDGKNDGETGLTTPDATVTFQLKDGAGKYTLKVGKPVSGGTNRYIQKEGDPIVYVTTQNMADWLVSAAKYSYAADAGPSKPAPSAPPGFAPNQPPGMVPGMPPEMMGDPHAPHH